MVEPIGLIGTLVAIVQLSGKVVSICCAYRMGVRDAPQEISRILDEVTSVGSVAQQLVKIAETDKGSDFPSLNEMQKTDGPLRKCLVELQDLKAWLKIGKSAKARSNLLWPLSRGDAERKLQAIASIKNTLQLALAADNASQMVDVLACTRVIPSLEKNIKILHHLQTLIGELDQTAKTERECAKMAPGTGDWLLNSTKYIEWKQGNGKLLWVQGPAGCG
ncbi:hypothetical protein BJY04DRAFT_215071 [Aspergillus karnatakaensis]|uniref:uncharacterized protein n=1 Tax=Aspergillus karnatakaensis TaxID=1810916 RepID=UPI003CCDC5D5